MFPLLERKHFVSLFLFSSSDISISLLRYMLLLKELSSPRLSVWLLYLLTIAVSDFQFCFPFDWECKGKQVFQFCKKYFFYFLKPFRVKNPLQVAYLPLFNFSRSLRLGVQR